MTIRTLLTVGAAILLGLLVGYTLRAEKIQNIFLVEMSNGENSTYFNRHGSDVILYSDSRCSYCTQARNILIRENISFAELFVDKSAAANKEVRELRADKVPVILAGPYKIIGFDENAILEALERKK